MKFRLTIISCFLFSLSYAQVIVTGKIQDATTGKAIPSASVYINQTRIGTMSDGAGSFNISNTTNANFDLVVSCIGYKTYFKAISLSNNHFLNIKLVPKTKQLENVVLHHYEKNGWEKWGDLFTKFFIGKSAYAKKCRIKNKEVIKFWMDNKNKILSVEALEPIEIENKALGYIIRYDMQKFEYDINGKFIAFSGFPFFIEMKGSKADAVKWVVKRKEVYTGSVMHFMRSLFSDSLRADGFIVQHVQRTLNSERQRVKEIYDRDIKPLKEGTNNWKFTEDDSISYYNRIMAQPDYYDAYDRNILSADSISFKVDESKKQMFFENSLQVIYTNKKETKEFMQAAGDHTAHYIKSFIKLLSHDPISIYSNGLYYDTQNLYVEGYWSWSEKIAEMLPYDYKLDNWY
ncbi:MAG: carboxypeptidase-like regulatory domain-containing protein [Ferruginibacter sp.]